MSNFSFLHPHFPKIHQAASRAEEYVNNDPRTACFHARRALELLTHWLYDNDNRFRWPYDTRLSVLLTDHAFEEIVPFKIRNKADLIRRKGNDAVHKPQAVKLTTALTVIEELFHTCYWLARTYGPPAERSQLPQQFDQSQLPPSMDALKKQTTAQLKQLIDHHKAQDKAVRTELEAARDKNDALQQQLSQLQAQLEANRLVNAQVTDFHNYNEAQTREYLIDQYLREAGWRVPPAKTKKEKAEAALRRTGVALEVEVTGMRNDKEVGYVDYVLWGDDGRPLALVEAKRTSKDSAIGKRQAELYADCLEAVHGQRPVIFYTNGHQIYLWDDGFRYPPRLVSGFYTKDELQRLIQRRTTAVRLDQMTVTKEIVDRDYQEAAIRHLAEQLTDRRRKGLLVMATGTGKTRTAIAIVDLLMRANWAKRVLFLADRVSLVNQAVKNFKKHLPDANPVNLLEEKDAAFNRVVVSTYQTMMSQIDDFAGDERTFSVGHFDMVIIDEAHRSVYAKFGAIFNYFDSLLLGLTATPKDEVDRNTYNLFDLADGVPTYAYDLKDAVDDGYLVPYEAVSYPTGFTRDGIRYDDLPPEEQERWDMLDWGDSDDVPEGVSASAINKWLFNRDTVDAVLKNLMENGIKVAGGDRLGKTIIFAKNQKHARFIAERFDHHYPHLAGKFAEIVMSGVPYVQTLIDDFGEAEKAPHIAISVDMLDTGIDVPEVVNLVFFKLVRSKTKFFQMIGRGTRLRPNLFGPDDDKTHFVIFDHCLNFEFFDQHPEGIKTPMPVPLSERLFNHRLTLLSQLRSREHDDEGARELAEGLRDELHGRVAAMSPDNFLVRPEREHVERFAQRTAWDNLTMRDIATLENHIAHLPTTQEDDPESAKRFDNLVLQMQIALGGGGEGAFRKLQERVIEIAAVLEDYLNIDMVKQQRELIFALQEEAYWETISVRKLEKLRLALRGIVHYVPTKERKILYTDLTDTLTAATKVESGLSMEGVNKALYKKKVEQFIRARLSLPVIKKIREAEPLTAADLTALEEIFFAADELGTREEFEAAYGTEQNLGVFIRKLVGLDRKAANRKFSRYLDEKTFTADQIEFVRYLIDQLTQAGVVEIGQFYERPFIHIHPQGLDGVFSDENEIERLLALVGEVNQVQLGL